MSNEMASVPTSKKKWKNLFHALNISSSFIRLPIFTILIYLAMNPALVPYLIALSPIFKPALLAVAIIGWSFSTYELFHENKYVGSRVADVLFKGFVVMMAGVSFFTALTVGASMPILSVISGVGAIFYSAGKTFYHSYKLLSKEASDESRDYHKKQARMFALATGVALVLGVAVGLNKVAHLAMTAVATVTAFVIGAAAFAGAWKKYSADNKKPAPKPEPVLQAEAPVSEPKVYQTIKTTFYQRPIIESREQLSTILDKAIIKYRNKLKMYGFVKIIDLKTNALECLKVMLDNPTEGKVDFYDKTYQWHNAQALKMQMADMYQAMDELKLFQSFNKLQTNQIQFLFDQVIEQSSKDMRPGPDISPENQP